MRTFINSLVLSGVVAIASTAFGAAHSEEGFRPLFNGKDLSGWAGDTSLWSVQDGLVTGKSSADAPLKNNTFLIWQEGEVADFELRFSYKIVGNNPQKSANSGLQYRSRVADKEKFIVGGYQADFEAGKTYSGILYEERGRGILAQRGQATLITGDAKDPKKTKIELIGSLAKSEDIQAGIKDEEWNDYIIIAKGNRLLHVINGKVTVDVTDDQPSHAAKSGVLAFQLHVGPPMTVQFKDVRIEGGHRFLRATYAKRRP